VSTSTTDRPPASQGTNATRRSLMRAAIAAPVLVAATPAAAQTPPAPAAPTAQDYQRTFVPHGYPEQTADLGEVAMNYAVTGSPSNPALLLIPGQTESWWGFGRCVVLTTRIHHCLPPNTTRCTAIPYARAPSVPPSKRLRSFSATSGVSATGREWWRLARPARGRMRVRKGVAHRPVQRHEPARAPRLVEHCKGLRKISRNTIPSGDGLSSRGPWP